MIWVPEARIGACAKSENEPVRPGQCGQVVASVVDDDGDGAGGGVGDGDAGGDPVHVLVVEGLQVKGLIQLLEPG